MRNLFEILASLSLGYVVAKLLIAFVVAFGGWSLVSVVLIGGSAWYGFKRLTGSLPTWAEKAGEELGFQ